VTVYADDMIVDKKDQLEKIEGLCLPHETIRAVFDLKGRGTGFLGITDKRIIYYDKEFMKKKKAIVSIPAVHGSISHSFAAPDQHSLLTGRGWLCLNNVLQH